MASRGLLLTSAFTLLACGPLAEGGTDTETETDSGGEASTESSTDSSGTDSSSTDSTTGTATGDGDSAGDGDGTTSGDGDGTSSGDGDGTTSGDGDGTTSGDGDGTTSGDGDGTTSGDGDGTTSGDGDGCTLGEVGCACFPNDTCFDPGVCTGGICTCDLGSAGCGCFPNNTCFAPLVCDPSGTCVDNGGGNTVVDCGAGLQCDVGPNAACCWDTYLSEGQPQGECVTGPPDNDGCATQEDQTGHETRIECQGPDSCGAGEICCGELYDAPMGQNYMNVTCQASCGSFTICTDASHCGGGQACNMSNYLPNGYGYCG